jgi:hypothetical protein
MNCALALPEAKRHFVVIQAERDRPKISRVENSCPDGDDLSAETSRSPEASAREQPRRLHWSNGVGL